jgi:hypothetical protein
VQHRSVNLAQQPVGDVHNATRIDPEQVAIEGEMLDRAQRHVGFDTATPGVISGFASGSS